MATAVKKNKIADAAKKKTGKRAKADTGPKPEAPVCMIEGMVLRERRYCCDDECCCEL